MGKEIVAALCAAALCQSGLSGQIPEFKMGCGRDTPVFQLNEKVVFTAECGTAPADWEGSVRARLYHDGKLVRQESSSLRKIFTVETALDRPGWILWKLELLRKDGSPFLSEWKRPVQYATGVIVAPFSIRPGSPKPPDLEKRWEREIRKLRAVPLEVKYVGRPFVSGNGIRVTEVSIGMGGHCLPVTGYLSIPADAKEKSLPLQLSVPGANLFPFSPDPQPYARASGVIQLHINPHGFPIRNCDRTFYLENHAKKKGGYLNHPWDEKLDRCYYRNVVLRMIRGIDFLKTLPQWDGKTIKVIGSSQGGGLAIISAALHSDVTEVTAYVPALCDFGAASAGHQPGWPQPARQGDPGEMSYLDAAHFASMIRCPITLYTGLTDTVCSPTSVFAACNSLPADTPRKISVSPSGGHSGPDRNTRVLQDTLRRNP